MSSPILEAFFFGRAVAEVLTERLEATLTDALSELGKFDAEAREHLRCFTEEVTQRANRAAESAGVGTTNTGFGESGTEVTDVQAMVDDLRAEIATLRTELQRYRSSSAG